MRWIGKFLATAIITTIFIPAAITIILGNNKGMGINNSLNQNEQISIEKEKLSKEQLIGIVAKEIPINYEDETLKTQVIMARSYIAATNNHTLSYINKEDMKKLWGSDYNKNYKKIEQAVEDTKNTILTYKDEPIQPVYHLQSAGITQSPVDIWNLDVPYLESVESKWDELDPDLIHEQEYNSVEMIKHINDKYSSPALGPYSLETQIQIVERTQGGYVKSIQVGNQLMSGDDFRKLLNLRSSCFVIKYDNNKVRIITKGVGHGVGLSQYGANQMAKEGKNSEEILKYYFPKATITQQK